VNKKSFDSFEDINLGGKDIEISKGNYFYPLKNNFKVKSFLKF
jgi:hypothetical protein